MFPSNLTCDVDLILGIFIAFGAQMGYFGIWVTFKICFVVSTYNGTTFIEILGKSGPIMYSGAVFIIL